MESNREEAERCIRLAKAAIESGNTHKARKFLVIAQRLRPEDPELSDLLSGLSSDRPDSDSPQNPKLKKKKNGEYDSKEPAPTTNSSDPSPEQIEIVVRINRTVDYYEILGLKKDCTEEDVRKAYRKLSLKVHPDKNKAPGAEEAFKSVSRAFQCLSNIELREKYDRFGPEEGRRYVQHQPEYGMRRRRTDFYEDPFDPDEIFNAFFFGGQARHFQRQQQFRTHVHRGNAEGHIFNLTGIIHLILIFLVIVLTSFPMSSPSHYSLQRESPYIHEMSTANKGVPYYVKSTSFGQEYPLGSKVRNQVEAQVERDYSDVLRHNCRVELNLRTWGRIKDMPNCKKLEDFLRY